MPEEPVVRLDREAGRILFPRGRAFLLGADVWSAMKVSQAWNPVIEANLKKQWVDYGRELGKRMWGILGKELDLTYGVLEDSAREAGWGVLRIEGDKHYGTHLDFKLRDCVFCDGLRDKFNEPCCYELAGTIEGVVEVLHGRRNVKEVKCASQVWDVCEIEVTRLAREI